MPPIPPSPPTLPKPQSRHQRQYHQDVEASREAQRDKHAARTPAEKIERVWRQLASPNRPRAGSQNSRDPRKAALGAAHMRWNDAEECFRKYVAAAVMSEHLGTTYVVDHSVPLLGHLVCGLHTHDNLCVISREENRRKSNTFWPQMWPADWTTFTDLLVGD